MVDAVRGIAEMGFGYKQMAYDMNLDIPGLNLQRHVPEVGLMTGAEWSTEKDRGLHMSIKRY
jgi:hypothetical protein